MQRQVITIAPDGSMSGLQRKPGQGIDLRQFGKADIKRASLIEWDEDAQMWFIDVLQDAGKGKVNLAKIKAAFEVDDQGAINKVAEITGRDTAHTRSAYFDCPSDDEHILFVFDDYDDAVKVEVAYLDALRLRGEFPR